jgi:hypothetical protein
VNAVNRCRKNPIVIMLALLTLSVFSLPTMARTSQSVSEIFAKANHAYKKGDYQGATGLYQQLLKEGYESGNLYYNLGNCYYKLKNKGRAILYYEKARRLIPGDADLKTNLAYTAKGIAAQSFGNPLAYLASLEQLLVICSGGFFLLALMLIISILATRMIRDENGKFILWWRVLLGAVGSLFLIGLFLTTVTWVDRVQPQSIVIGSGAVARYEPNATSTVYYQLPEGIRVKVLTTQAGWSMVQRADGKSGWVKTDDLERI